MSSPERGWHTNIFVYSLITIICLISCSKNEHQGSRQEVENSENTIQYATKFERYDDRLVVTEPWPGAVDSITYQLGEVPERIVVTSTTHLPYLEMLDIEDKLVGFPGTQYITSRGIRKMVEEGKIKDLGQDGGMNLELLLSLEPDAVFAFDMGNESTTLDKIEEAGIPVIYNADFLETSALGRAEWIRFYGAYFHKEKRADSLFNAIANAYDSLKIMAAGVTERPTVLTGVMYGDTWFLPGGRNWAAELYKDAGGRYIWENNPATGWIELSFETVFDRAHVADYWIGISTFNTLDELTGQDERYRSFEAFKEKNIYNYNKRRGPSGGYDFFESGYARPDIVLADLIKIIHPDLLPDYETYYFQQVQ